MANSLLITLRSIYFSSRRDVIKLSNTVLLQSHRTLYVKTALGIDTFVHQKQNIQRQMANIQEKFKEKMNTFTAEDSKSMIFTEDLKNMIHLAETDEDFRLAIKMMKKFNSQNKQLRFGNFVFGPVIMRLFHLHNRPDLALECFKSPELEGLFDQLITYQILLDLLYENGMYKDMLSTYEIIRDRQIEATKYPRNVIVLTMAACFKLNSQESLEYALNLWHNLTKDGHFPMRRAVTFCAGLALNQGKPDVALEIISAAKNANYTTVRNIKAKALCDIGRLDDALMTLKSIISEDTPGTIPHTFNRDVLDEIKNAVSKLDDADMSLEFNRLEKMFEKQGHISNLTLNEQLCSEIQQPSQVKQQNRLNTTRMYNPRPRNERNSSRYLPRPGLKDMV